MAEAGVSPAAHVDPDAVIGAGVAVAPGVVIHAGVRVGAGCVIEDLVVLGKRPRLRAGSSAATVQLRDLELGERVTVCCGAVVYAGAVVAAGAIIGDQAQVREGSRVGERSVVGRASCVDFNATVGDRVSIQTGVYVTSGAVVEDDVFLGPGVLMTNDNTMGRHPKGEKLSAPIVRRAARVGGAAVLVPGVEVGEEAYVGAGAVVTRDVAAREVVVGLPARAFRQVGDSELLERWR
jgi:UDP-3-O-[3-hydroxymyristoyl] glucosamine N-acyltransferase